MSEQFSADIAAIESISAVPSILDVVCRTTGMGFAAVARVTEDHWIACSLTDKISFGLKPGGELPIETTICNEIRQSREAVVINHVSEDPCYREHHVPALYGFQSYISMPIILQNGKFFGTLCAIDPRPAQVNTPQIISMFKLFAELIAFHLDAMEKVSSSESRLREEKKTSELREQFIAVLGHDLRNPLGAISSGAMLLKQMPLTERGANVVEMIQDCVSRMGGLIDNVLDFARGRLGSGLTLNMSEEPLEPLLNQVTKELRIIWPERQVQLQCALKETVNCDHGRIAQLYSNLLGNALTYGASEHPVRVRAASGNGTFELSVANAGEPISAAAMERLFHPFSRGEVRPNQQGLGLGLYIASEIARAHGGTLGVVSTNEETCFTLTMPTQH